MRTRTRTRIAHVLLWDLMRVDPLKSSFPTRLLGKERGRGVEATKSTKSERGVRGSHGGEYGICALFKMGTPARSVALRPEGGFGIGI